MLTEHREKESSLKALANPESVLHLAPETRDLDAIGMGIKGKAAIVVGGGRGIGRAIALQLAKAGARVCITAMPESEVQRTAEECLAYGAEAAIGVTADACDREQVKAVVDTCVRELGEPFILVCSQGYQQQCWCEDVDMALWKHMWAINVDSVLYYIQEVGKYMIHREPVGRVRGKIIIVSSITGLRGGRGVGLLPYHMTKGAICSMIHALGQEWAKYDINVNGIAPGTFLTALSSWTGDREKERRYLDGHIPMAWFKEHAVIPEYEPELVGTMALYLASPASDYTTSQVIAIDGGTIEHFV